MVALNSNNKLNKIPDVSIANYFLLSAYPMQ